MSSLNASIQTALNYSETADFAFAIVAAVVLFVCRLKRKVVYGFIEVGVGLYLASFSFQSAGDFSKDFSDDFDVVHLSVVITTYLGSIFVMVRGFDNIHSGWKPRG